MTLPSPQPGLVIRYSYLWVDEYEQGREEGVKDRPCAVVAAIRIDRDGKTRVLVVPITHSPPVGSEAIEIPPAIKARLMLDAERSWIILSEANEFFWPGPDVPPVAIVRAGKARRESSEGGASTAELYEFACSSL